MANGKIALAPDVQKDAKIRKVVTKKLYGRQKPKKQEDLMPTTAKDFLESFGQMCMIIPSIVIGVFSAIGAAFEIGLKKALETYRGK
jgi:hypothetical protein